jgi:hypothetical protein
MIFTCLHDSNHPFTSLGVQVFGADRTGAGMRIVQRPFVLLKISVCCFYQRMVWSLMLLKLVHLVIPVIIKQ